MTSALKITNLQKTYGNGFQALKGIDLEVQQGDFFALLGPNGAGKSTTLGIVSGLVNKSEGEVEIFGHNLSENPGEAKRHLGVVPQEFNFNQFEKVQDIIIQQAGYYGIPAKEAIGRTEKYLKQLELWDKRDTMSRMLSGGMKRRLMIARALVHEPKMLILDEPTAGVDIEIRRSMWDFLQDLNKNGTTIILTTHYLEEAESLCRNIGIINSGTIIKNTTTRDLLRELHTETFIMDMKNPVEQFPSSDQFKIKQVDAQTIELEVDKSVTLNEVFAFLSENNITITSMRTKSNRLEELFVNMVSGSNDENVSV